MLTRALTPADVRSILVVMPNWVGDVVMATPAVRELRERFPDARIAAVCRPYVRGILEDSPRFDEIVAADPREGTAGTLRLGLALRRYRFDLAVVLPHSFRSALLAWLAGARWRVGYGRNGRSALLNHRIPSLTRERNVHGKWQIRPEPMVKHYLHVTRAIGCLGANTSEELFYRSEVGEAVDRLLAERGVDRAKRLVGVNPGASFGSSKMWGAERFAALADRLVEDLGAEVLLFGGPGEEPILEDIRGRMRAKAHAFGPGDATLSTLKAFVDRLDLLVTNDTGPRHYAVAFDKPVVVVMGPTDPRYTDVNMELTEVLRRDVPCGPCHLRVCPIDHKCMTEIAPDEVFEKVKELLETAEFRMKKVLKRKKRG